MNHSEELIIRPAAKADRAFAIGLVPRLRSSGKVPLRSAEEHPRDGALGFAYAVTATDYFTQEAHGHLAIIAVAEAGEGRALRAAVEAWALERGDRLLTLNVFEGNARARALYERNGYSVDMLRCIKELAKSPR